MASIFLTPYLWEDIGGNKMNIIVLAGGLSTERDVSISTGKQVCKALREKGHNAAMLDVFFGYEGEVSDDFFVKNDSFKDMTEVTAQDPDLEAIKSQRGGNENCLFGPNVIELCSKADIVYMALHGAEGENGKVQAAFDLFGIKYTGSGYLGSALAMDKGLAKTVLQTTSVPMAGGYVLKKNEDIVMPEEIGYPCIVKPVCGGSSVGVGIANNDNEFNIALKAAFHYEDEVLVEAFIKSREFSVGVMDGQALPIIEIIPKEGFYDYKTKYQPGMAQDVCPAELDEDKAKQMQEYAVMVYHALHMEVYGRIDFLMDDNGAMYCLEANTLPGMTPTSLLPQEAAAMGVDYGSLCEKIIQLAMKKYE